MHNRLKLGYIERFTSRFQNGLFRESLTFTIDGLITTAKKPGLYTISRHGNSRATSFKYIKIMSFKFTFTRGQTNRKRNHIIYTCTLTLPNLDICITKKRPYSVISNFAKIS